MTLHAVESSGTRPVCKENCQFQQEDAVRLLGHYEGIDSVLSTALGNTQIWPLSLQSLLHCTWHKQTFPCSVSAFCFACLPLTWLQLPVSLCSERETVWSFFWVLTVKQELSLLFTIFLSYWTLKKMKGADAPLYSNAGLSAKQQRSLCVFTP